MNPPKVSTSKMKEIIIQYLSERLHGDASKLKFTEIAAYGVELGYPLAENHLRQRREINEFVKQLKSGAINAEGTSSLPPYKRKNPSEMLKKIQNFSEIETILSDMDSTCAVYYEKIIQLQTQMDTLRHTLEISEQNCTMLKIENEQLHAQLNAMSESQKELKDAKRLQEDLSACKSLIDKVIFPEIANKLFAEKNNRPFESVVLDLNGLAMIMEGEKPASVNREQTIQPTTISHAANENIVQLVDYLNDVNSNVKDDFNEKA